MEQLASLLVCCAVEFRHLILGLKRGEQLSKRRQEQLNGANFKLESIVPWSAFHGNIGAGPLKKTNVCDYNCKNQFMRPIFQLQKCSIKAKNSKGPKTHLATFFFLVR